MFYKWRIFFSIAAILFALNWILGIARFHAKLFKYVFNIINLPSSYIFLWLENKSNIWWYGIFGQKFYFIFNDEAGMALIFIMMSFLQAAIITFLLIQLSKRRNYSNEKLLMMK